MADLKRKVQAALGYDPETGIFTRKVTSSPNPRAQAGKQAGGRIAHGYRGIRIDGVRYLEHRLAWFITYGYWPKELDHINGQKDDNRIANLREATRSQNMANGPLPRNSTSGVKGVSFDKATSKWIAYATLNGKMKNLGRFDSKDAARAARQQTFRKAFSDFARV